MTKSFSSYLWPCDTWNRKYEDNAHEFELSLNPHRSKEKSSQQSSRRENLSLSIRHEITNLSTREPLERIERQGAVTYHHYRQRELRVTHPRSSLSLSLPFLRSFCSTWHHRPSSISLFQFLRCCCSRLGTLVAFRARNKKKEEKEEGCSARQSELEACFWPRRSRHPFNERELFARWTFSLSSLALRGCYDSFLR